jgi:hypothetical protein
MTMDCAAFRDLAPELALGIAVGDERAAALDHLAGCGECRDELTSLAGTVDLLVGTAPAAEPPSGFEVRALSTFEPAAVNSPRRGRRILAVAAAILVVLAIVGVGASTILDREGSSPDELALRSGSSAALAAPDGSAIGTVRVERTVVDGDTSRSELVVSVDAGAPQGGYRVQCDYESGRPYDAGDLQVGPNGLARWGATVSVPTYDLRRVRLVSTTGGDNLEAEFA